MLLLLLVLFLGGAAISLLMWLGGSFIQGYFYTEPSAQLYWQAPAAGFTMGAFFALWCLLDLGAGTPPPLDVLQRFTARQDKYPEAAREIIAVKKDGTKVKYRLTREGDKLGVRNAYKEIGGRGWPTSGSDIIAIEVPENGSMVRYDWVSGVDGANPRFASSDGWSMPVYSGLPSGIPEISRTGRILGNLTLNFTHLILWFVVLWLLMRFQWPHALGFAFCLWGLCTLIVLPILLDAAANHRSASRPVAAVATRLADA